MSILDRIVASTRERVARDKKAGLPLRGAGAGAGMGAGAGAGAGAKRRARVPAALTFNTIDKSNANVMLLPELRRSGYRFSPYQCRVAQLLPPT